MLGFDHDDFSIDSPEAYDKQGVHPYIAVTLKDCYRHQGKRVLCLGSMTIKEDTSPCDIDITRFQTSGWWDISVEEGEAVRSRLLHFDKELLGHNN